jgi:hypothetical protein
VRVAEKRVAGLGSGLAARAVASGAGDRHLRPRADLLWRVAVIRGGTEVSVPGRARKREGESGIWDRSLWECLNERAKMGAGEIRAGTARSRGPAARFARGSEGAGQPPALAAQARCFARGSEGVAARAAATGSEKAPAQAQGESRFWASCGGGVRRGGGDSCGGAGGRARLGPGGPSCRFRRRGQTPPSTGGLVVESCSDSGRDGGVSPRACAQARGGKRDLGPFALGMPE